MNLSNSENKENEQYVKRHEEYQYLDLVREVIHKGKTKMDRTNVGTVSIFGAQSRYSLRNSKILKSNLTENITIPNSSII